jgi:predicted amidohydrolase
MKNVTILAFSFDNGADGAHPNQEEILRLLEENIRGGEDIVLFPECFIKNLVIGPDDPFMLKLKEQAAKHKVYILVPLARSIDEENAVVCAFLLDRQGEVVFCYDKAFPYWDEYKGHGSNLNTVPGNKAVAADTDFGRISVAICFDANFSELWKAIADKGPDVVFFVSAYSAGQQLAAYALNHHYNIVACTRFPDFSIYDIAGREKRYARGAKKDLLISRAVLDLDKVICHENFNTGNIRRMIEENPGKIEVEAHYEREQWMILRSLSPEISARALCEHYHVEWLSAYQKRSRDFIEASRRGTAEWKPNMC